MRLVTMMTKMTVMMLGDGNSDHDHDHGGDDV